MAHQKVTMNMPDDVAKYFRQSGFTTEPEHKEVKVEVAKEMVSATHESTEEERRQGEFAHLIPPKEHPPWFVAPEWYPDLLLCLQDSLFRGTALMGGRGTLKSTAVLRACGEIGLPYIEMPCHKHVTWDDLRGHCLSKEGTTYVAPAPLTISMAARGVLFLDEFNGASPDVIMGMQPLTANLGAVLGLQDGTTVTVPREWKVVVAYNQGLNYAGTKPINAAMLDRLQPIFCPYPARHIERQSLSVQTGCTEGEADQVLDLVDALRKAANEHDFDLSLRPVMRMIRFRQAGRTWEHAFQRAILELVGPPQGIDQDIRETLMQTAISAGLKNWDKTPEQKAATSDFAKSVDEIMNQEVDEDDSDF